MSYSWKDRLRALKDLIFGRGEPAEPTPEETPKVRLKPTVEETPRPQGSPEVGKEPGQVSTSKPSLEVPKQQIGINLGIDFGTSFTKVCFRDVGGERSGVVTFGGRSLEASLIPSVVSVGMDGKLYFGQPRANSDGLVTVRYLKMRLAGLTIDDGGFQTLASYGDDHELACALSSWFLATLIHDCQQWIAQHQRDRVKNRHIVWSANVGVPVEHYDSDKLKVFDEVLGVAWLWIQQGAIPANVSSALMAYRAARTSVVPGEIDCHAFPEIAAAVQSFIISREARRGIYIYFDIGGGTIDGVAFDFVGDNGERRVNFYSGKVAPLGVSALLTHLDSDCVLREQDTFDHVLTDCSRARLSECRHDLQLLVAGVIVGAKRKDHRDWRYDEIQTYHRPTFGSLATAHMRPLVIFVGGGGSRSEWYRNTIKATHGEFNHKSIHIPPYRLAAVPKPRDLDMGRIGAEAFDRFAVAYGLSIPFGEGPTIGLPSQFQDAPPLPPKPPPGGVSYEDSKDAYD